MDSRENGVCQAGVDIIAIGREGKNVEKEWVRTSFVLGLFGSPLGSIWPVHVKSIIHMHTVLVRL